jgi:hypothetical protein
MLWLRVADLFRGVVHFILKHYKARKGLVGGTGSSMAGFAPWFGGYVFWQVSPWRQSVFLSPDHVRAMESTSTTARSYKSTFFGVCPDIELSVIAKDPSRSAHRPKAIEQM